VCCTRMWDRAGRVVPQQGAAKAGGGVEKWKRKGANGERLSEVEYAGNR